MVWLRLTELLVLSGLVQNRHWTVLRKQTLPLRGHQVWGSKQTWWCTLWSSNTWQESQSSSRSKGLLLLLHLHHLLHWGNQQQQQPQQQEQQQLVMAQGGSDCWLRQM
jgi:hypothetical protein